MGGAGFEVVEIPHELSEKEAGGMTVNERLYVSGLMRQFDDAVERKDTEEISEILRKLYLDQPDIDAIIGFAFRDK